MKMIMINARIFACGLALSCALLSESFADTAVGAHSVAVRIALAGQQRMLSERMAKSLCFARSGVDPMQQVDRLQDAMQAFDAVHRGLVEGNDALELYVETDPSVLEAWENLDILWFSLNAVYSRAIDGAPVSEREFSQVLGLTLEVDKRANDLVAQIRHKYAEKLGSGGLGKAILLDLYDRQRMLSQKLSKEVCLLSRGHKIDETAAEMAETLKLFDTSLRAFLEGMPIAGIPKPPSPAIAEALDRANEIWIGYRPVVSALASGGAASLSDLARVAEETEAFLLEMNTVVKLYEDLQGLAS